MYKKIDDGVYYSQKLGRIVDHHGRSTTIYWNATMLDYLKRNFSTMLNKDLAEWIGVSESTVIRKARQLGLEKDKEWLDGVWSERRKLGHVISKKKGYPGCFKKGMCGNPGKRFEKGHTLTPEQEGRRVENMKRWYKTHPIEARQKMLRAWETRRAAKVNYNNQINQL